MKTLDCIKEVLENDKEYKINYRDKEYLLTKNNSEIIIIDKNDESLGLVLEKIRILQLEGWEEVKKPVDFKKAFYTDSRVKVEHEYIDEEIRENNLLNDCIVEQILEFDSLGEKILTLTQYFDSDAIVEIIRNGKWYIED